MTSPDGGHGLRDPTSSIVAEGQHRPPQAKENYDNFVLFPRPMTVSFRAALSAIAFLAFSCPPYAYAANTDEIQIVTFGTSFTNGKGVWPSQAYPARLEALLRSEGLSVHVKNQGKDGDTSLDLVRRLNWAVPEGVQLVILEYAIGNDRQASIPMERTVENVDTIISRLVARHIEVLLLIRGEDQEALRRRMKWFRPVIEKYGISFLQIEQPVSSLLNDRQHPTAEAHASIAASMVPSVKRLIERVRAGPR